VLRRDRCSFSRFGRCNRFAVDQWLQYRQAGRWRDQREQAGALASSELGTD